ncbi:unnamed protein product [Staurois parvus]|uniref:Uncharacterized protein n=1 Tax=Staurois parvus TaxID=386267 RepID=A0ABN9AA38_9NEOB|nr:unnamed protein product [Staurois parvus]
MRHQLFCPIPLRLHCCKASSLAHYTTCSTITSKETQTTIRLLLPRDLAKHQGCH